MLLIVRCIDVGPVASWTRVGGVGCVGCGGCVCVWVSGWRTVFGLGCDGQFLLRFCFLYARLYMCCLCRICWGKESSLGLGSERVQCVV